MTDPYLHNREFFGSVSGNYHVLNSDTGLVTLVPAVPAHTLFIQKLHIEVTTLTGAELWTFQDGAGVPIVPSVSAGAISHFDFDFGPDGVPCTESAAFVLNITGAVGAIGWVTWEGFKKLTLGTAPAPGIGAAPAPFASVATAPFSVVGPTGTVFTVTPAGNVVAAGNLVAGANITLNDFGAFFWTTRTLLRAPANGRLAVTNNGETAGVILDVNASDGVLTLLKRDAVTGALVSCGRLDVTSGSVLGPVSTSGLTGFVGSSNGSFFYFTADGQIRVDNNASSAGIGLDVTTNGTLKLRNRLFNGDGQFSAGSVRGNAVTFANLPAAPVEGMVCWVTDSTVNTWGTVIAGGGANHVLACFNGTAWTVAGK